MGEAKSTMGITNLHLRRVQVRRRGKMGSSKSLLYTHSFPLLSLQFITSSTQQPKRKLFLGTKNIWGGGSIATPRPLPSYAYALNLSLS